MYRIQLNNHKLIIGQNIVATIGNFDGIHHGHMELLRQLNQQAPGAWRVVITFDVLPHEYFADQTGALRATRISLLRDKVCFLQESGLVDEVVVLHFNRALANLTAEQFIQRVLQQRLGISQMVVGHDFRFGYLAAGTIEDLQQHGINTFELAELKQDKVRVSSSLIRQLASKQQLELIRGYLGHNICYTSRIVRGNQLARTYAMPTINLNLAKIRPVLWGIYTSYTYIEGQRYPGVTNIGRNPTVSEGKVYKIETHLLDINLNLYGKIARVEILHYLRPELKFDDLDSLFKQMHQDMVTAREFFAKQGNDNGL